VQTVVHLPVHSFLPSSRTGLAEAVAAAATNLRGLLPRRKLMGWCTWRRRLSQLNSSPWKLSVLCRVVPLSHGCSRRIWGRRYFLFYQCAVAAAGVVCLYPFLRALPMEVAAFAPQTSEDGGGGGWEVFAVSVDMAELLTVIALR
jgi:hypothetical protein